LPFGAASYDEARKKISLTGSQKLMVCPKSADSKANEF
jgi:hypothetical protein